MIDKRKITTLFTEAVQIMRETHCAGTYFYKLGVHDNQQWAIVLGWRDGFEADPNDDCMDGEYRLCAKLAYQPTNSLLQCGYDIDWLMPYDEETGEVYDTEISIYPTTEPKSVVAFLLVQYREMLVTMN